MADRARILVVGVPPTGDLPPDIRARVERADVLVGGERHLALFPAAGRERIPVRNNIEAIVDQLRQALARGERAVVLASGDPLCYGIGATLRRYFTPEDLEIHPAASAFQMAFAALAEPWHDARLLSAHGRPWQDMVAQARAARVAAILTDDRATPAVLARAFLEAGLPPDTPAAVCENLGTPDQRVHRGTLADVAQRTFARLNVFVVWPGGDARPPRLPARDDIFHTRGGLFTKRELRLLALAELDLRPGEVLWDIGAGSGAVSIEAAYRHPEVRVYAVERRPEMARYFRRNLQRFPAPNVRLVVGEAPDACAAWPRPHAVFVGGTGRLEEVIPWVQERLRPGGRLVVHMATLESLERFRRLLPEARVTQIHVSRGAEINGRMRFEALNPVFVGVWWKDGGRRDWRLEIGDWKWADASIPQSLISNSPISNLFVVGVGPGEEGWLTVAAAQAIAAADVVFAPCSAGREESLALRVVRRWIRPGTRVERLALPMQGTPAARAAAYRQAARRIAEVLAEIARRQGHSHGAYVLLGDPMLYGTFAGIGRVLAAQYPHIRVTIVPGVPSFAAAAARLGWPLGQGAERILILPATRVPDAARLREALTQAENVILMKVGRHLPRLMDILERLDLLDHAVYAERVGLPDERIVHDLRTLRHSPGDYFSLILIRAPRGETTHGDAKQP